MIMTDKKYLAVNSINKNALQMKNILTNLELCNEARVHILDGISTIGKTDNDGVIEW
jgi:hypothetical protein